MRSGGEALLLQLLGDAEARVEFQHAADGQGNDPLLAAAGAPFVHLHAHHHQGQHKATTCQELLAAEAQQGDVAPLIFRADLHEGEHEGADAVDKQACRGADDIRGRADEHQYGAAAETKVLQGAQLLHSASASCPLFGSSSGWPTKTNTSSSARFM